MATNVWVTAVKNKSKIEYLVVDTNTFIEKVQFHTIGERIYTTPTVIAEIKDTRARQWLDSLPIELIVEKPTAESIEAVTNFAAKTGDLGSFRYSIADLHILALTYQLEARLKGTTEHLRKEPHKRSRPISKTLAAADVAEKEMPDDKDDTDTPAPAESAEEPKKVLTKPSIGMMTKDFAMQNVGAQMGLKVVGVNGNVIRRVRKNVLRCHACFTIVNDTTERFCPSCGKGDTLVKIGVKIDQWGVPHYFKGPRISGKGTNQPLPKPRGGPKHQEFILSADVDPEFNSKGRMKQKERKAMLQDDGISFFELDAKGPAAQRKSRRTEEERRGRRAQRR
ncbi:Nin one binding (NOB1) Zn-ribbon like [Carpediemonas membranifera]|uniref:Nin one binding (NOB1) Zn-ribbon like n=1 Tax=Carpediemonas membranifera TaxID=201153 RepID=A0A8J6E286_9EUKA|nr:Nin one binding (NOB1) Zn-ribbon like [Carpediemonas membranifera]|eukprot:KAG9391597.1 Nin one binding (NOB1) Zn-ribbon like [Carpediemonas membranifera]